MTDLYLTPGSAPCRAAWMTVRALGMECNIKTIDLMKGEQMSEWYLKINPQHCVPTLDDKGFSLWESRAIMPYLVAKYGKDDTLYPKDPQKKALVDQCLNFDIGNCYKNIGALLYPQLFQGDKPNPDNEANVKKMLETLNTVYLGKNKYVAGDVMTVADLSLFASVTFLDIVDFDFTPFENVNRWCTELKKLPYFQECNEAMYTWKVGMFAKK